MYAFEFSSLAGSLFSISREAYVNAWDLDPVRRRIFRSTAAFTTRSTALRRPRRRTATCQFAERSEYAFEFSSLARPLFSISRETLRERPRFGSSSETYLPIYCGVFYTEYRVTSTAYADSYQPICRAIGARVRILVSRVDPFAHHHLNRVLRPTGQLSVIEVDIRNRYYYSTTQNRNTGNLHRPPGGLKTRILRYLHSQSVCYNNNNFNNN